MRHPILETANNQLIENQGINLHHLLGQIACLAQLLFPLQLVDQVHGIEETHPLALVDG